jgi:hypothetical protein
VVDALSARGIALPAGPDGAVDGSVDVLGTGLVDSLGLVELLVSVEEALGSPLALEEIDFTRMDSLDAIVDEIHRIGAPAEVEGTAGA